jgi:hypothetical protein
VVQALLVQRVRQGAHDVLLPDQRLEGTRPPLAREDLIAHGGILSDEIIGPEGRCPLP